MRRIQQGIKLTVVAEPGLGPRRRGRASAGAGDGGSLS